MTREPSALNRTQREARPHQRGQGCSKPSMGPVGLEYLSAGDDPRKKSL